jgi:hypothetical protein
MPLCVKQKNQPVQKLIVRETVSQVTLTREANDWVNFNYNKSGYCRYLEISRNFLIEKSNVFVGNVGAIGKWGCQA